MRNIHRLLWAAIGILLLPVGAAAQQPMHWQPTLESAKRLAGQTDRLVLIHFWAESCRGCQIMDREVFSQSSVARAVESDYVPVKVNTDYFPTTCKQYGVTALPTDIVITPQGYQIAKLRGPLTASEYVARLNQVAAATRQRAETYAQIPTGQVPAAAGRGYPPPNTAGYQPPNTQQQPDQRYANYDNRQPQAAGSSAYLADRRPPGDARTAQRPQPRQPASPPRQAQPQAPIAASANPGPALRPPSGGGPSSNPPLGLDGYCPVQLSDDMYRNLPRWTLGDRRWGAIHRGRTYLFAGPEQQRRFLADPDRYAPVLSGNDVVLAVEQGQAVPGRREHGALFASKAYLFSSEASYEKFSKNPHHYAKQILQAMRAGGSQRQQLH